MLSNLLPGIREIRTPLAAGYIWLIAWWLVFAPMPSRQDAEGLLALFYNLVDATTALGLGVAVSFVAYLIGSVSTGIFEKRLLSGAAVSDRGRKTLLLLIAERIREVSSRLKATGADPARILSKFRTLSDEWQEIQAEAYIDTFAGFDDDSWVRDSALDFVLDRESDWSVSSAWGSIDSGFLTSRLLDYEDDVRASVTDPIEANRRIEANRELVKAEVEERTKHTYTVQFSDDQPPKLVSTEEFPWATENRVGEAGGSETDQAGVPNGLQDSDGDGPTLAESASEDARGVPAAVQTEETAAEDAIDERTAKDVMISLRDKLYDQVLSDDLDVVKARLIMEAPNFHSVVDRYHAEAALRMAILPPGTFLLAVVCWKLHPWWLSLIVASVGAAMLITLYVQGRTSYRKGNDLLADALRLKPLYSHTIETLGSSGPVGLTPVKGPSEEIKTDTLSAGTGSPAEKEPRLRS
jgi:hypothetical protein